MKKLILWDIDGTLIVSGRAGIFALAKAFEQLFGRKPDFASLDVSGRTDQWISRKILEQQGIPVTTENIHGLIEAYLVALPSELRSRGGNVLPGIIGLLESFRSHPDVVQGLLTGNVQRGARIKLEHYQVWHYFEFGAFGDDSAIRNELGPHAVRRAREKHAAGFEPENVFVIGDTPHDIECGKAIGARTIGVATGRFSGAELASHQPTAVFPDLSQPEAFQQLIESS